MNTTQRSFLVLALALLAPPSSSFVGPPARLGHGRVLRHRSFSGRSFSSRLHSNADSIGVAPTLGESTAAVVQEGVVSLASSSTASSEAAAIDDYAESSKEVAGLLAQAARLRAEAATAEAELMAEVQLAAAERTEALFKSFDADGDGFVDAKEIAAALVRQGTTPDTAETYADEILAKFDTNADAVLSLDEFPSGGASAMQSAIRDIRRAEREGALLEVAAEQTASKERADAQALAQWAPQPYDKAPGVPARAAAALPYLLPLLDAVSFAPAFVAHTPVLGAPVILAASALRAVPFGLGPLAIFLLLNSLAGNPSKSTLLRFSAQQAVSLDIALFIPSVIFSLGGSQLPAGALELGGDAVFVASAAASLYAIAVTLGTGAPALGFPLISQNARDAVERRQEAERAGDAASPTDEKRNDE